MHTFVLPLDKILINRKLFLKKEKKSNAIVLNVFLLSALWVAPPGAIPSCPCRWRCWERNEVAWGSPQLLASCWDLDWALLRPAPRSSTFLFICPEPSCRILSRWRLGHSCGKYIFLLYSSCWIHKNMFPQILAGVCVCVCPGTNNLIAIYIPLFIFVTYK